MVLISYAPIEQLSFVRFRNSDFADSNQQRLGPNPLGNFYNAMEVCWRIPPGHRGAVQYRVRRTIEEELWQRVAGPWSLVSQTAAGTADDPEEDSPSVTLRPPYIYSFDAPGWILPSTTRQFRAPRGQLTAPDALKIVLKQNFREWVDGAYERTRERVSRVIAWHNLLCLQRDNANSNWSIGTSEIAMGRVLLGQPLT
jgi:hypothetical protein